VRAIITIAMIDLNLGVWSQWDWYS